MEEGLPPPDLASIHSTSEFEMHAAFDEFRPDCFSIHLLIVESVIPDGECSTRRCALYPVWLQIVNTFEGLVAIRYLAEVLGLSIWSERAEFE